jgi:hypothetical protein
MSKTNARRPDKLDLLVARKLSTLISVNVSSLMRMQDEIEAIAVKDAWSLDDREKIDVITKYVNRLDVDRT